MARTLAGTGASVSLGIALGLALPAFGAAVLDPSKPAFHCVSVGALTSACLALARERRFRAAAAVAATLAPFLVSSAWPGGAVAALRAGLGGAVLGAGVFLSAVVFDALAESGYRFLKFLATGPLVGGAYLAATPVAGLGASHGARIAAAIWLNTLLGIVIGDGAGFGVEIVDLLAESGQPGKGAQTASPSPPA